MHLLAIIVQTFVVLPLLVLVILSGNFSTNDFLVLLVSGGVQFFVFAHMYILLHSESIRKLLNEGKLLRHLQVMELMVLFQLSLIVYVITLSPLAQKTIEGYHSKHIVYIALPVYAITLLLVAFITFLYTKSTEK